ncbi:MAG: primosomal protein N' family DNA-binding protein [Planctomycetota bacterium]|jgi:primosomal protein N'
MTRYKTDSLFPTQQTEQTPCNYIIRLAFDSAVDNVYDYAVPDELWPIRQGQRIEAPFGRANKPQIGFCVSTDVPQQQN